VIVAMPYGCLSQEKLSQASRLGLEKALDWWQKSMQTSKHKTYFVLAGYDDDAGQELQLRRQFLTQALEGSDLLNNVVEIRAKNEIALAQKISHVRDLLPIETITVFVESHNAVSVKAIFRRKFSKTLVIRKFKADFEFDHHWITTSTSFAWFSRNWLLRLWFELKKRLGRRMRKKIRFLFRS
jgi:hypothetical protein